MGILTASLFCMATLSADPLRVEPEDLSRRHHGQRVLIEDRVSSVLGEGETRQFRLRRCPQVIFEVGSKGPRALEGNVRVVGTARFERNALRVDVESVDLLVSDLDEFDQRSQAIAKDDFERWYALAEWARQRARLYSDDAIRAKSVDAYAKGMLIERAAASGEVDRLRTLRERVTNQEFVDNVDVGEIDHAILRSEFSAREDWSPDQLEALAEKVLHTLDPQRQNLPMRAGSELAKQYLDNPIKTFRTSDEATRLGLARLWEVQLHKSAWDARIAAGGVAEGYRAWDWSQEALRDYSEIGMEWLNAAIAAESASALELDEVKLRRLTSRIRTDAADPARAAAMEKEWLELREKRMRDEEARQQRDAERSGRPAPSPNVRGRYDIAMVWRKWFGDENEHAITLLLEVVQIEATFEPAVDALQELGFTRLADGRWLSAEAAREADRQNNTPRTLARGMEEDEVVATLGQPDARFRVITGRDTVEHHWTYRTPSGTTHVILLSGSDGAPTVSAIHRTPSN